MELVNKNEDLDLSMFQDFCDDHIALLQPAKNALREIKKKCLGQKVWKRLSRGRAEVMQWKYMDVMQIMVRSPAVL